MTPIRLLRAAGLLAIISAGLSILGDILSLAVDLEDPALATSVPYTLVFGLYLVSTVLLLLALVGLYTHQSASAGVFGAISFLVSFVGTALLLGAIWFELFITPSLATAAPTVSGTELGLPGFILSFLLAGCGWLLFGIATLRAHVYPRSAAIMLIAGALLSFTPLPLSGTILSLAIGWLGFVLYTGQHVTGTQASRVT